MIFVGIDVAKDKHDCFITNSDGDVLFQSFTIANNLFRFDDLYQKVVSVMENVSQSKSKTGSHWALQLQSPRISL